MTKREELFSLVSQVPDPVVRSFALAVLKQAPSHFWVRPSSLGKYHPPDEWLAEGLLLHTIRVTKIGLILCRSQGELDKNVVVPACLLHDVCRYGDHDPGAVYSVQAHPALAAQFIGRVGSEGGLNGYVDLIKGAVASHMGRWGLPVPVTAEEWAVHLADNIASKLQDVMP